METISSGTQGIGKREFVRRQITRKPGISLAEINRLWKAAGNKDTISEATRYAACHEVKAKQTAVFPAAASYKSKAQFCHKCLADKPEIDFHEVKHLWEESGHSDKIDDSVFYRARSEFRREMIEAKAKADAVAKATESPPIIDPPLQPQSKLENPPETEVLQQGVAGCSFFEDLPIDTLRRIEASIDDLIVNSAAANCGHSICEHSLEDFVDKLREARRILIRSYQG
jgi:hypothetical protein